MLRHAIFCRGLLSVFLISAIAALPLTSPSSTQLSFANENASVAGLHYITNLSNNTHLSVDPPFTPGSEPSEKTIFYDVPFSNPPVTLKLKDYHLHPDRNETHADNCFQKAIIECGDRRKHFTEMEERTQEWKSGNVFLSVLPLKDKPDDPGLTYGMFTDAMQGLNNFRLFYPHLNFIYEIYVYLTEGQGDELYGLGQLGGW